MLQLLWFQARRTLLWQKTLKSMLLTTLNLHLCNEFQLSRQHVAFFVFIWKHRLTAAESAAQSFGFVLLRVLFSSLILKGIVDKRLEIFPHWLQRKRFFFFLLFLRLDEVEWKNLKFSVKVPTFLTLLNR